MNRAGFTLIEALLATAMVGILFVVVVGSFVQSEETLALTEKRIQATLYAEEGVEAVRSIRDNDMAQITAGTHGLTGESGVWAFSGSSDVQGDYTRTIDIQRVDDQRFDVTSTVNWVQNARRDGTVHAKTRLTAWHEDGFSTCNEYVESIGFSPGTCRENAQQCGKSGEHHAPEGDQYCSGGSDADTCCGLPDTCEGFARSRGYQDGTCRENTQKCIVNDEQHLTEGDSYCDVQGPEADTCCVLP